MIERKNNVSASVFVKIGYGNRKPSPNKDSQNFTKYDRNVAIIGTPSNLGYIGLEQRRKYTYYARESAL